ncbi:hypothetical protein IQ260_05365 [Leptolyngbya cf. ectocarpi LEGE 11479]|uniref:RING-type domain-containing protein n=1 Tax=Leptolyngbya cf. ectocarpi LEGE 11479 TaxID=1828722 RepID=A0A928X2B2_LEPEC|nr:hypothetical protein [Leptolyngbya ectocarpi]MBE9066076.1 hypothetical protein [Leptolyngbya cf. ectocarpi LEGE 11479]
MQNFNLIENALDSLEHAIAHLATDSGALKLSDHKRVILDLSHVAELLFKERLRRIHPAFVFSKVDQFPSKSAHTVGAAQALQRLEKIGGINFDKEDQSALETIREKRNEIEHYEFQISEAESRIVIGNVLVFIFKFASDELELGWASRRIDDPHWAKLNEFAEFFESQRRSVLNQLLDSRVPTQDCPICSNNTFDLEAETCLLCGHREEVLQCRQCGADYLHSDIAFEDFELCPKCEWEEGYAAANFEKY